MGQNKARRVGVFSASLLFPVLTPYLLYTAELVHQIGVLSR